jgi:CheY-like chemotaxis protein
VHRILVAEDDAEMRCLVVEALRKDGHEVVEAEDGRRLYEAVASAIGAPRSASPFDLIISDVRMPVRSALDVLEEFVDGQPCPPVILMTAFPNEDTRRRAGRLGALLLDKPLSLEVLRSAVNRLVAPAAR